MDSILQFILSTLTILGLTEEIPVVSAETLEENWSQKYILEIKDEQAESEPSSLIEKTTLLALTDETLYWVVAVLDGDSLLVSGPNRELFQVRLLAVDTNEINGPDSTAECYGAEAAEFTLNFLQNRAVRLTADPANEDLDPYGRQLRYVDVLEEDGSFLRLNDALLLGGYATFPKEYLVTDRAHFEALEQSAQDQGKGLWAYCS